MNTKKTKETRAASDNAVIIHANPADFRKGTQNRAEHLVEALEPITNIWYSRFYKAAQKGGDAVILAWDDYRHEYFPTIEHEEDEVFCYAALLTMLRSVYIEAFDRSQGIRATTQDIIGLVADKVMDRAKYWWPRQRFEYEAEVIDLANYIDSLADKYPIVK